MKKIMGVTEKGMFHVHGLSFEENSNLTLGKNSTKNFSLFICKSIRWEGAFWSNKKQVALF